MRAKYAVLGAAAVAGFSIAAFSPDALATACPAATTTAYGPTFSIGANVSCAVNDNSISIVIKSQPTTTIYNLVDNSVNYTLTSGPANATISNFIESAPITTIYNLVNNSFDLNTSRLDYGMISIFVESVPITTIYNLVDNSINYTLTSGLANATISNFIESAPITTIYNLVNNSLNLNTSRFDYGMISIFIESAPITTIYNLVDNSVNYLQTSVGVGTMKWTPDLGPLVKV